jgi:hypothetical protein
VQGRTCSLCRSYIALLFCRVGWFDLPGTRPASPACCLPQTFNKKTDQTVEISSLERVRKSSKSKSCAEWFLVCMVVSRFARISHTNEFCGKYKLEHEPLVAGFLQKVGRWTYEKGLPKGKSEQASGCLGRRRRLWLPLIKSVPYLIGMRCVAL